MLGSVLLGAGFLAELLVLSLEEFEHEFLLAVGVDEDVVHVLEFVLVGPVAILYLYFSGGEFLPEVVIVYSSGRHTGTLDEGLRPSPCEIEGAYWFRH